MDGFPTATFWGRVSGLVLSSDEIDLHPNPLLLNHRKLFTLQSLNCIIDITLNVAMLKRSSEHEGSKM